MTTAITAFTPTDIMTVAKALIGSGFLPRSISTVDQAFAIISMAQELGIGMWQGINGINVIQGKPTVSPQLMLALINRSGQLEDMQIDATAERAIVTLTRKGRTAHTETFSFKDATAQGLTGKDNYKKQPATMLKWRAVAACARVVFPDAIMGLYTTEEIAPDAVTLDDDGSLTITREEPAPQPTAAPVDTPKEREQRTFNIVRVKRAPVPDGKPVWGMWGVDADGIEVAISGLETRDMLGAQKGAADGWDTKVNAVTVLEETISVKATFEDGRWWFDEAVGS